MFVDLPEGMTIPTLNATGSNRQEVIQWTQAMQKAMGAIRLRLSTEVMHMVKDQNTPSALWSTLKSLYGTTSAMGAFNFFKQAVNTRIPSHEHPRPSIAKIQSNFDKLQLTGIDIPADLRALIILNAPTAL